MKWHWLERHKGGKSDGQRNIKNAHVPLISKPDYNPVSYPEKYDRLPTVQPHHAQWNPTCQTINGTVAILQVGEMRTHLFLSVGGKKNQPFHCCSDDAL